MILPFSFFPGIECSTFTDHATNAAFFQRVTLCVFLKNIKKLYFSKTML